MGAPPPFDSDYEAQIRITFGNQGTAAQRKAFWQKVSEILQKYSKGPNVFRLYPFPPSPDTALGYSAKAEPKEITPAGEQAFMQAFKDVRQELEELKTTTPHDVLKPYVDEYENVTYIKGTTAKKLKTLMKF